MSFLHETRLSLEPEYRWRTAAQQAIIESQEDLRREIRYLRQDLANANYEISDQLAVAILEAIERIAKS